MDSLTQAIGALEQNQATAFLQTSGAAVLRRRKSLFFSLLLSHVLAITFEEKMQKNGRLCWFRLGYGWFRLSLSAAGPPECRDFGVEDMTTQNRDLLSSFLSSLESLKRWVGETVVADVLSPRKCS